jgi:plasmid stabilization system protein ParE
MAEVRWTPQAAEDLEAIAEFIAADSPRFAGLFVMDTLEAVNRLSSFPRLGRMVPETGNPSIREILLGNYRIVYRVRRETVEILTVWQGARLFDPRRLQPPGT